MRDVAEVKRLAVAVLGLSRAQVGGWSDAARSRMLYGGQT